MLLVKNTHFLYVVNVIWWQQHTKYFAFCKLYVVWRFKGLYFTPCLALTVIERFYIVVLLLSLNLLLLN